MRRMQKLQLCAAIFIFLSIGCSLLANRANRKLMGQAAMGVAVWAPEKGSAEWRQKEKLKAQVDLYFYGGVIFALLGLGVEVISIFATDHAAAKARSEP